MDTIIKKNEQTETDEIRDFLKTLTPEQQRDMKIFIRGIKFAQAIEKQGPAA